MKRVAVYIVLLACAWTAKVEARLFTFQAGGKVEGEVLQFNDLNTVVIRGARDAKPYALKISMLISEDQRYLIELWGASQKPKVIETTVKEIRSWSKESGEKHVWMDAVIVSADNSNVRAEFGEASGHVGFEIRDKNGDVFSGCLIATRNDANPLQAITKGDSVRVAGIITKFGTEKTWLLADEIIGLSNSKRGE